ncbi:calpain-2 catalytic subunit-like [Salminus brasiliensis]|uniref:calpain-2 catalytic subunit-like n=1 Tax=Salminus brasiliensis TaxID=930266 RepID=UPI003B82C7F9
MSTTASTLGRVRARASVPYLDQDFQVLRNRCLSSGQLFRDPAFPAAPESLGFDELGPTSPKTTGVQWMRPRDLCSNPQFIAGGATRTDICQGSLGDCWLMAAIASLTLNQDVLAQVIYPGQSFTEDYAGIFHFQLWQYGQWVDVVVDDKLPTINGKLLFVQSADRNEFWTALLEKAYAKVNGSYEALKGGCAIEGFEDFTGGISERYQLSEAPANLFRVMKRALKRGSLLSTAIAGHVDEAEEVTKEQLVKRHAYSVTAAVEVHVGAGQVQLVRLRNPWGHKEWSGAWSDESREWSSVPPQVKAKLNHCADDGEFWMSYTDFKEQYSKLEICNLIPDAPSHSRVGHWDLWQFEATFRSNRQFLIKLSSKGQGGTRTCSVLVGLMQKNVRKQKQLGCHFSNIGFAIYPVPKEYAGRKGVHLSSEALSRMRAVIRSEQHPMREVCQRFELLPGEYVIIPSTHEPNQESSFLLRVFCEK